MRRFFEEFCAWVALLVSAACLPARFAEAAYERLMHARGEYLYVVPA